MEGITRWRVRFRVGDSTEEQTVGCVLEDGRNPLEDFPLMISVRIARPEVADRIEIMALERRK